MAAKSRPWRLGLTGGIGSGKSTVGGIFTSLGAELIDADQIARDVTGPGGVAIEAIRSSFGDTFIEASGALNRARMRQLVFTRPDARVQLERIVHPLVTLQSNTQVQRAIETGATLIVHDIPLLAESGKWAPRLDAVVVIDCSPQAQIERVIKRSGLAHAEVLDIIASQASRQARRAVADVVIANEASCTLEELRTQVVQTAALFGL